MNAMFPTMFRGYVLFTGLVETAYFAAWPFWSFKDAHRGTLFERAAALRHNIGQRHLLLGYAARWVAILAGLLCTLDLTEYFMTLPDAFKPIWLSMMVGVGISIAFALVVLFEILVVYAFLSRAETVTCNTKDKRYP